MAIDYQTLKNWPIPDQLSRYTREDCIRYALSLGYGEDPLDAEELPFVYEEGLRAVPSMVTVLGAPGAWATDPGTGIDWMRILHGEHRMALHASLPPEGCLRSRTRVTAVVDKGQGRGALVVTTREVSDEATGRLLATIEHTSFCRADGGFGPGDDAPAALPAVPPEPADTTVQLRTVPSAALLYRLNGDRNPIHADPAAARSAGFERPILHGLCTYGMAVRAVLRACCGNRPERLGSFSLRFSAPFIPGETLAVEIWRRGAQVQFRASALERGQAVLTHGLAAVHGA
ncbi:MaoC/PaaZ C-terminal domain-containing protein [Pseudorhodoferax sp. LjRoot39]|uniref:MaoC/PaaZ C-terminal domain-containing protein n=1 Tax=Pseudorhodoferax sp. LjRoot39 TaxID=3342328 RepID=UPI003ECCAA90